MGIYDGNGNVDDSNTSDAINMTKKYSQQNHVSDGCASLSQYVYNLRGKLFWLEFLL